MSKERVGLFARPAVRIFLILHLEIGSIVPKNVGMTPKSLDNILVQEGGQPLKGLVGIVGKLNMFLRLKKKEFIVVSCVMPRRV